MNKSEHVEFVTVLGVPVRVPSQTIENLAEKLERAVESAISVYPAVTAYFVQGMPAQHEIHIGLRFEDVDSSLVEDWSNDIVKEAFEQFTDDVGAEQGSEFTREDSGLVVA